MTKSGKHCGYNIIEIFYFLTIYVQSCLLQNCCMRERVKLEEKWLIMSNFSSSHNVFEGKSMFESVKVRKLLIYPEFHYRV